MTDLTKNTNNQSELLKQLTTLIDGVKTRVAVQVNSSLTVLFWQIGRMILEHILQNERADYGKHIIPNLSEKLVGFYGRNYEEKNLRRMIQFAEQFPEYENVVTLSRQLSWSHFLTLIPIRNSEAKQFYAKIANSNMLSVRELRKQIEAKVYERTEKANLQISESRAIDKDIFKDPYFLDFLNLRDGYLENDLETAILKELELFILELGNGFSFIERQKRIILDGEDHRLDLLFYHRKLKRLVAIELKIDKFKAKYKGQMELYLKWLDRYEKQDGEKPPVGLILCTVASKEQIELLEMHKDGIMVAEYWTELPPKKLLEEKLHSALIEARERIERKRLQ